MSSRTFDRRRFLESLGLATAAAAMAACDSMGPRSARGTLRWFERRNEALERWLLSSSDRDRVPADARGAGSAFPKYYVSERMPMWDPAIRGVWRLEIGGSVRNPIAVTLDELSRLPSITQKVNHYCVEGWTARATWTGVRLSELARIVDPNPDARYVDFRSFDSDYHESWDLESAMHPQTIVAYGMDGRFLGPGHGAPARVHSPTKLGYKNTKYLTRIVFLPERNGGYWSDRGYEWYGGV
jgi:DMSO/TMAO reductase YedYZ molybdopterin-dependent catalytic subunit